MSEMFQVMDIEKHKDDQDIEDISDHNLRKTSSRNIDKKRSKNNRFFIGSPTTNTVEEMKKRIEKCPKYRKDAVKVVQLVLGASPEFFKGPNAKDWEVITHKWACDTFGKENIIYSVVHNDEKTKHMHICFTPIFEGKLRAAHWFDGPSKLNKIHNSYNAVMKPLGLRRGRPALKPTQTELDEYYKKVNASTAYERKIDNQLDDVLAKFENPTIGQKLNPWSLINEIKPLLKSLAKNLSVYRTKAKEIPDLIKDRDLYRNEYNQEREKVLKYTKMLKDAGISPESTPEELALFYPVIKAIRGQFPSKKPEEPSGILPKEEVLILKEPAYTPHTEPRQKMKI